MKLLNENEKKIKTFHNETKNSKFKMKSFKMKPKHNKKNKN